jgi:hypothetical protein
LVITIRTTGDMWSHKGTPRHVPLLIFCFDSKINKVYDLKRLTYYRLLGATPEGLCLDALNKYMDASSYYLDSYLINMSDGMPNYEKYLQEPAYKHTSKIVNKIKRKNINLLSYFISDGKGYFQKNTSKYFKEMYGRDAKFIDVNDINQVTQTLNKLFLSENMVS